MRQRELHLNVQDQKELNRIKSILFPKKQVPEGKRQPLAPKINNDNSVAMRSEIDKLRGEINTLLLKGKGSQILTSHTEKAYLDGINKLSKELKYNACDINEVFDEFLAHLPTKFTSEIHHYTTHYYYSMLVQNVVWGKVEHLMKRQITDAFLQIKQQSVVKKEMQEQIYNIESQRKEKTKLRNYLNIGKYFSKWRLNNSRIKAKAQAQDYLKENSIDNDQKLIYNLLNLPLLTLMLEQLGLQSCDMSEILILDDKKEKACKFIEQGQSMVNSSLQTVTQRSLLQTQRPNLKFSRFDIDLNASLTKQCIQRGQILFVDNLSKNIDYSQIDNLCYWQSLGQSNPQCLKGGAIFYPIFDINQECIGILRQYFYEGGIKGISSKKLQKICVFLELGIKMDKRMRIVGQEKQYQKQGYYVKMIELIKNIQTFQGSEKNLIEKLSEQLKSKLQISKLTLYRVQFQEEKNHDILLKKIWGQEDRGDEDGKFILTLVHQLLKQHSNFIYLDNRLLVYSNLILFDLVISQNVYSNTFNNKDGIQKRDKHILPIELIVGTLTKIQTILLTKEKENQQIQILKQKKQKQLWQEETKCLHNKFQSQSIKFISSMKKDELLTSQINAYIHNVHSLINQLSFSEKAQYRQVKIYLQCKFNNTKKDRIVVNLDQVHREATEQQICRMRDMLHIQLCEQLALYCDINLFKQGKILMPMIKETLKTFLTKFLSEKQNKQHQNMDFKQIQVSIVNKETQISSNPSKLQKKLWEKTQMTLIYQHFKEAVDQFLFSIFGSTKTSTWTKQKPDDKNIEEWKNSLYKLALLNPSNITFNIINKNPILSYNQYKKIRLLTNYSFNCISEESSLVISANKPIYRSKNMMNDNLALLLPLYIHIQQQEQHEDCAILSQLNELKMLFIRICQHFIKGVNNFNLRIKNNAASQIFYHLTKFQMNQKNESFRRLKKRSLKVEKQIKQGNKFYKQLNFFMMKIMSNSFHHIYSHSQYKHQSTKNRVYSLYNLQKFAYSINTTLFKKYYGQLMQKSQKFKIISCFVKTMEKLDKIQQKQLTRISFFNLQKNIRKQSKAIILYQIIKNLIKHKFFYSFQRIKLIKEQKIIQNISLNQIQKSKSFEQLKRKIAQIVPKYSLFLQINEDQCYTIHSICPQHYKQFPSIEQTYNPQSEMISYQCGSEGQLIWNYQLGKDQNCFQIKDKLNSLGKYIEFGIKNCRKLMGMSLFKCSIFHRTWIKRIKSNTFRRWLQQSQNAGMQQKNRLNDSLYQISIQTQTIKQKLKCQQKIIKNHQSQYQQLLKKQQQYKTSISLNNEKIETIEENQGKLQSAKLVFNSLHRRSTMKTIFLLWRANTSQMTLLLTKRMMKGNMKIKKVALKSIQAIISSKMKEYLRQFTWRVRHTKQKQNLKSKSIQKIEVMFQQRANRLITFQSEFQQQENSSRNSNRQLEQTQLNYSKRIFDRSRSPLQRVELSEQEFSRYNNGAYKLNPKTLKFLKRMGKLQS